MIFCTPKMHVIVLRRCGNLCFPGICVVIAIFTRKWYNKNNEPKEVAGLLIYLAMIEGTEEKLKFEQLYEKYRFLMYHVAYKILGDHYESIIQNFEKISLVECSKSSA